MKVRTPSSLSPEKEFPLKESFTTVQRLNDLFNQEDILHALKIGVMIIDRSYKVLFCNSSISDLLGLPANQIRQKYCYELSHKSFKPCSGEHHICPFDSVFNKHQPITVVHKHYSSEGHNKYVEIYAYPIRDFSTREVYMVEMTRDITEEKAMNISKKMVGEMLKSIQEEAGIRDKTISRVGRKLARKMTGTTLIEYFEQFFLLGMGSLSVERIDNNKNSIIITGINLVESIGNSELPTCSYTLGFLCEIVSKLLNNAEVSGIEVNCRSMADELCRFVLKPSAKVDILTLTNQEEKDSINIKAGDIR